REHVARCPECSDLHRQMAGVTRLLADSPASPMPAAVTARIEAARAAGRPARSAGSPPSAAAGPAVNAGFGAAAEPGMPHPTDSHIPAGTATPADTLRPAGTASPIGTGDAATPGGRETTAPAPSRPTARPPRTPGAPGRPRAGFRLPPRLVTVMAAAAVVVAGGGYALSQLGGGAPSMPASAAAPRNSALGPVPASGKAPLNAERGSPAGLKIVHSGTDYRPGQLARQVSIVLANSRPRSRAATQAGAGGSAQPPA